MRGDGGSNGIEGVPIIGDGGSDGIAPDGGTRI
jgi:hypothetical protein